MMTRSVCLLCYFEQWYYEWLTGQKAAEKLRVEHHLHNPLCPGEFISYGGDPLEKVDGQEWEEAAETEEL